MQSLTKDSDWEAEGWKVFLFSIKVNLDHLRHLQVIAKPTKSNNEVVKTPCSGKYTYLKSAVKWELNILPFLSGFSKSIYLRQWTIPKVITISKKPQ
jgi:hypothetical protein